jgi:hypothetical protein
MKDLLHFYFSPQENKRTKCRNRQQIEGGRLNLFEAL